MDFSKFRNTGELTDITVLVEGTEFKLHKFPLFAKSDFFCNLARSHGTERMRVDLKDFPGGAHIFSTIADYCYSIKIDVTKNNIVSLRCASEYLKMSGKGNLSEITEKFLHDTITSSKMSRSTGGIISLLVSCVSAGPLAETAGIVKTCIEALVDCWLKPPTKFSSPYLNKKEGKDKMDDKSLKLLVTVPPDWFAKLVITARDNNVGHPQIAEVVVRYINSVLEKEEQEEKHTSVSRRDTGADSKSGEKSKTPDLDLLKDAKINPEKNKRKIDIGMVLDTIIMEVPKEVMKQDCVPMEWVTRVLRIASSHNCKCRNILLKMAGDSISKLSSDDLCIISPSLLREIVQESFSGENNHSQNASKIVDTYMSEMARKGVLTAETFKMLSSVTPKDSKPDQDRMFEISEYFLNAEKEKLSKEQLEELLSSVDFTRLSLASLNRALEKEVVPAVKVARGALALCSRLEKEMDALKTEASAREQKLALLQNPSPVSRSSDQSTPPKDKSPPSRREPETSSKGSEDNIRSRGYYKSHVSEPRRPLSFHAFRPTTRSTDKRMNTSANVYSSYRPLYFENELSLDEELDLRYDSPFRSLDPGIKSRSTEEVYGSPYTYSHFHRI